MKSATFEQSNVLLGWDTKANAVHLDAHSSCSGYLRAKAMRKPANDCPESQRTGRAWHTLECPYIPLHHTSPAVQDASPQPCFNMLISFCLILRPPSAAGSERPAVPCTRKLIYSIWAHAKLHRPCHLRPHNIQRPAAAPDGAKDDQSPRSPGNPETIIAALVPRQTQSLTVISFGPLVAICLI